MSETSLAKIAITTTSDNEITSALDRVNRDFEGGRVTKTDFTSWLILRAIHALDEAGIEEVRKAHFNQVVYLENLVKNLKSSGRDDLSPEELGSIQAMLGRKTSKKRGRPPRTAGETVKLGD